MRVDGSRLLAVSEMDRRVLLAYAAVVLSTLVITLVGLALRTYAVIALIPLAFAVLWMFENSALALGIYLLAFSFAIPLFKLPVQIYFDDLLFLGVFAVWIGRKLFEGRVLFRRSPLNWVLVAWLGATAISILMNLPRYDGHQVLKSAYAFVRMAEYILIFYMVTSLIDDGSQAQRFLWVAMVGALWVGGFGAFQWLVEHRYVSVSTLSENHLHLGAYALLTFFLALGLFYGVAGAGKRLFLLLVMTMLLLALIGSQSRAAWAGFLVAMTLFSWLKRSRGLLIVVVGVAVLFAVFGYAPTVLKNRMAMTVQEGTYGVTLDLSTLGRIYIWYGTIAMIQSSLKTLLVGVGLGAFSWSSLPFLPLLPGGATGAHNNFLHVAAETGLLGLGVWLVVLFRVVRASAVGIQLSRSVLARSVAIGYLAAFCGLVVTSLTQETLSVQEASANFLGFFFFVSATVFAVVFREKSLEIAH